MLITGVKVVKEPLSLMSLKVNHQRCRAVYNRIHLCKQNKHACTYYRKCIIHTEKWYQWLLLVRGSKSLSWEETAYSSSFESYFSCACFPFKIVFQTNRKGNSVTDNS
ncbi:unnamed protein product [Rangifer tarandus platyrhynchus]|uniref:Uncharacterized protein n=2 Tax=Rangifer tarandus platyrhynchus TaxID=3082113 RepID=A0ABN8YPS3_RANTA|nr:unnamed protein product [Rangifer tarandus platyrhynchus]